MLTHMGRCSNCGAGLRVFDYRMGSRVRFSSGVTAPRGFDDDQVALEESEGSFRCPRCDATGRVVDGVAICPENAPSAG